MKEFGERLRSVRREKGFSQEDLALACGLDRSYVGGIERSDFHIHRVDGKLFNRSSAQRPADAPGANL